VPLLQIRNMNGTGTRSTVINLEHIMFAYLLEKLGVWMERAEQARRDAYLASSADLEELERRMQLLETKGYID
jgi:hypothetical protein